MTSPRSASGCASQRSDATCALRGARTQCFAGIAALALGAAADAGTIDVPSAEAPTLTIAINIASSGDEIVVGPGTYYEAVSLNGKTLTIRSSDGPQATIIDGLGQFKSVVKIVSAEGAATLIEGFTIRNGTATAAAPGDRGGGIYCNLTSPTISNCVLEANSSIVGGAFYANGGSPQLVDCVFADNSAVTAAGDGGAIYANNSSVALLNCAFLDNSSVRFGGAIRSAGATSFMATRCDFERNLAGANGGVIDIGTGALGQLFQECRFVDNVSGALGGAVQLANASGATHQFVNCLFFRNVAATNGGAVHVGAPALFVNCTMAENSAGGSGGALFGGGSGSATVRNSIVWANVPTGLAGAGVVGQFTCHQSALAGAGNFVADPLFVDLAGGDVRLMQESPCIDAGNTTLLSPTVAADLEGMPRVVNNQEPPTGVAAYGYFIDMGAFEHPAPGVPASCPGDINLDGAVNGADLGLLLAAWGLCD